jgi:hypothetical protein
MHIEQQHYPADQLMSLNPIVFFGLWFDQMCDKLEAIERQGLYSSFAALMHENHEHYLKQASSSQLILLHNH